MKKIKALTVIFLVLTLMLGSVQTFASNGAAIKFADVKDDYWGKASIDYVSSKGYMVGYGKDFGVLDNVTEGQYLAVLCRIFGYKNQSPLTVEEPARALGLLQPTDVVNIASNLTRGNIAKYTIRAFEKLNPNISYPDYLEGYSSTILDFNTLSGELKPVALKCVEKGLLAGGPDGKFNPNDYTTRSQAAAFIHRILEQSERNKVKPIFATPDAEFEAFMNSEESSNYVKSENYIKVENGAIVWTTRDSKKPILLPTHINKDINREAYEAMKVLVNQARMRGHYVYFHINNYEGRSPVLVINYYNKYSNASEAGDGYPNFRLFMYSGSDLKSSDTKLKYIPCFVWDILSLGQSAYYNWTREEIYKTKATLDEFKIPLKEVFRAIYPVKTADFLYEHTIEEWNTNWDMTVNDNFKENVFVKYYQEMNLELFNARDDNTRKPYFLTNDTD